MHLRRSLALATGALVLAVPALTSCGFDYATDRIYTQAAGVNDRDATVDVLGAVVVSAEEGSGIFVASFSNNNNEERGDRREHRGETPPPNRSSRSRSRPAGWSTSRRRVAPRSPANSQRATSSP